MELIVDVHLHSRYAMATSRELNPENLHKWAALKGISVVGTGDFTHPEWLAELCQKLEPAEPGLLALRKPWLEPLNRELPEACDQPVRFALSVERLNRRLASIGNLAGDGRPILKLDCRDLLEICLEACPETLFIPAHIWTPHFSALGARSGFDSMEECFEDLLPHIFAIESGLSADPAMIRTVSALDRFTIVSNSDAHSPQNLGREATCLDVELSYSAIFDALVAPGENFLGTLEFYPQEGKYHLDGHRKCQVRLEPAEARGLQGLCPACGRRLTAGGLHRVEELADRPGKGLTPPSNPACEYLISLPEVISQAVGVGPTSKRVQGMYHQLMERLGAELTILRNSSTEQIARYSDDRVAEGVRRMRSGEVEIDPGYDGQFGTVRLFDVET